MRGTVVLEEKWPVLGRHVQAAGWLRAWTDLERAPRTIDTYARRLAEYLETCEREGCRPAHGESGACRRLRAGVDRPAQPPWRERGGDRLRLRAGECHDSAAAGVGATVL
ncbi:hypothetical protein RHA1_ro10336 (plasmid) [Rhodococcus jostii RHA1]|uniref:Uncharacterized protein n=1 Tax=Rhodococcus jostii (strain RHA1) TaxID=101510 RepID=Q0RW11_RHOJR|nr:hypothetical protein RHA1_ro10336 [Rhodococcus jostii RHA1]